MTVGTSNWWVYWVIWGYIGSYRGIELNENRRKWRIVMLNFIWGLPKVRGVFWGIPIIGAIVFGGSTLGSPYFGKLPSIGLALSLSLHVLLFSFETVVTLSTPTCIAPWVRQHGRSFSVTGLMLRNLNEVARVRVHSMSKMVSVE